MRDLALDPLTGDLSLPRGADGLRRASLTAAAAAAGDVARRLALWVGPGLASRPA